jgi:hypothetical protein
MYNSEPAAGYFMEAAAVDGNSFRILCILMKDEGQCHCLNFEIGYGNKLSVFILYLRTE